MGSQRKTKKEKTKKEKTLRKKGKEGRRHRRKGGVVVIDGKEAGNTSTYYKLKERWFFQPVRVLEQKSKE